MTTNNIFVVQNLHKRFPVLGGIFKRPIASMNVLNGISLEVPEHATYGIVGESGCGKSTLAKLLVMLETPTEGTIDFDEMPYSSINKADKKRLYKQVQMIFQDPYSSLNPKLSVHTLLHEMLAVHNIRGQAAQDRIDTILDDVGLPRTAQKKHPHEFSGGQRQRIAIARALIIRPRVLIADEPVSALDLALQSKIMQLLSKLKQEYKLTVIMISHDIKTVSRFCTVASVMYCGTIVETIGAKQIFTDAFHPYLQGLCESVPISEPAQRKTTRMIIKGEVPDPLHIPCGCPFHPRCPKALDICSREKPPETMLSETQKTSCWLAVN